MKKKSSPLLPRLVAVVAIVLIAGAAWQYMVEKNYETQQQERTDNKQMMQDALGWGSELHFDKKENTITRIRFMLRDKQHNPIKGADVKIILSSTSQTKDILTQSNITLSLPMVEPGVYRGQIKLPHPGTWNAAINAQIGQNTYQITEHVALQ
ncbi:MAG: hypothetical protein EB059_01475 [Alphaproteobacteria bacterium]|nr:hypothetical protein [Alphaproteobacteria bacterium]